MNKIRVKEGAWIAAIAAKFLGCSNAAIVVSNTIYIYGVTKQAFLQNERWLRHELQHVLQYYRLGFVGFLFLYLLNHIKYGYRNNPLEVEARAAETDISLISRFEIV